jgi:multisubunit Na+/H+ antiporter MnhF subunit
METHASMSGPKAGSHNRKVYLTLGLILAAYFCARILEIAATPLPRTAIVALDVLSAMAFALVDGARHYRLRGILAFAAVCIVVGNIAENLGVTTGFPFGRYYFVELMGPMLFHVPVLLGLAYIGMAYVSWTVARLIVGQPHARVAGLRVLALPLVASFVMVAWDLAQDPVWVRDRLRHLSALRALSAPPPATAAVRAPGQSAPRALLLPALRGGQRTPNHSPCHTRCRARPHGPHLACRGDHCRLGPGFNLRHGSVCRHRLGQARGV